MEAARTAAPSVSSYSFTDWLIKLDIASDSEIAGLALVNAEGTAIGDAAFAVLANRKGIKGANAAIAAEKAARELDVWSQQMAAAARVAMAS